MTKQRKQRTIGEIGEFGFLRRLLPTLAHGPGVVVAAGDDCAVVATPARQLLFTVDALVDRVHFRRGWMTPRQLGRRAYLVNASDIAAMGGTPRFCVVSVGVPGRFPADDLAAIHHGVAAAAAETGACVVGGNVTRATSLFVSVALIGDAPKRPLRRNGAQPGDRLYVTGSLGEAALGLRMLQRDTQARGTLVRRFREPKPRLQAGAVLARAGVASAAIDISDGLLQDLHHLCDASKVGARIEAARLPCPPRVRRAGYVLALSEGEDYELLCAVPGRHLRRVRLLKNRLGCRFTPIGECTLARDGVQVVDERGRRLPIQPTGFEHFRRRGGT